MEHRAVPKHERGDTIMKSATLSICPLLMLLSGCLHSPSMQGPKLNIVEPVCEPTCITMLPNHGQKDLFDTIGDTSTMAVDFFVSVYNQSGKTLLMPAEWSSWGYDNLNINIKTQDGSVRRLRRRACKWTKNIPTYVTIKPFGTVLLPVSLDMRIWENMPLVMPGEKILVKAWLSCIVAAGDDGPTWNDVDYGDEIRAESDWREILFRDGDFVSPFGGKQGRFF